MGLDSKTTCHITGVVYGVWCVLLYSSGCSEIMSRTHFEVFLQIWYFSNKEECSTNNRFFKIQTLLNIVNNNFKNCMVTLEEICIDESLNFF